MNPTSNLTGENLTTPFLAIHFDDISFSLGKSRGNPRRNCYSAQLDVLEITSEFFRKENQNKCNKLVGACSDGA